jgi:spore maturation protein SpmA
MLLNYIWIGFFLVALLVALLRMGGYFLQHIYDVVLWRTFELADRDVFVTMVQSTFSAAETSVKIAIYLIGIMSFWLGIMKIGEKGGAVTSLSRLVSPFFRRIFPEIPKNHPAMGAILMNFSANMLGLDNAATPLGLKAMRELQNLNPTKDTASNAQIMFLVLNTSGLTIIPVSIIALRASAGAANPADVFLPILLSTFFATLAGLISVSIVQKINLFNRVVLAYLIGICTLIAGIFVLIQSFSQGRMNTFSVLSGNTILFGFIMFFILIGLRSKINLYESFVEGAKEGFEVAVKIIPYLVAMLVAIGIFRASGAFDFILDGAGNLIAALGFDTSWVPALPTAIMKPLSGSGARGMMVEAMQTYGADSFAGRMSCIFQGSTETTFYIVAVYYGAVNIYRTRYTIGLGLFADLVGVIAAIFWCYLFFGS